MKLNHVNLTVTDVSAAHKFMEKYFGLQSMGEGNDKMAGLFDDNGLALVLMKAGQATEVKYPASFPIGFLQKSEAKVNGDQSKLAGRWIRRAAASKASWGLGVLFSGSGRVYHRGCPLTCAAPG